MSTHDPEPAEVPRQGKATATDEPRSGSSHRAAGDSGFQGSLENKCGRGGQAVLGFNLAEGEFLALCKLRALGF